MEHPIQCECAVLGNGCSGPSERLYLVVYPDKSTGVVCNACIEANKSDRLGVFHTGTLIYEIGDDVTNFFL